MRISGTHLTRYDYSESVFLEPHTIRLRPRFDPAQIVHRFSLEIEPKPQGSTDGIDAWGNDVTWTWFSGTHRSLEIATRFDVETLRTNPFDFVLPSNESILLPATYRSDERGALEPYLALDGSGPSVRALADEVARAADGNVLGFASGLAANLHERCEMIVREHGDPFAPEETLAAGRGSCRDIAVAYVEASRHAGLAARFVSGYVERPPEGQQRELHAWAEVYVPGGGWRAFDPSQGLAVSTGHVAVAAAAWAPAAAPVTGTFRSSDGAPATLTTKISLDVT